jgi:outer membrane protein TolC
LSVTNKLDQSNGVFGFKTPMESVRQSLNADIVTTTVTLNAQRQWGNRAARGAVTEADSIVRQQRLVQERVARQLEEDYDTASINLASARQRLELARNGAKLADAAYETAFRLMSEGMQASYETLGVLQQRVGARMAVNAALIDLRLAEIRLYGALGLLAERSGQRTAQTSGDRQRIEALQRSGQLRHFRELAEP